MHVRLATQGMSAGRHGGMTRFATAGRMPLPFPVCSSMPRSCRTVEYPIFHPLIPECSHAEEETMAALQQGVRVEDGWVVVTLRVPYADTDKMEHVYYANYLVYFEIGRNEWMRAAGFTYDDFEKTGYYVPVAEAHVKYKGRVFYDDVIEVWTMTRMVKNTRIEFLYQIRRPDEEKPCVLGRTQHAVVKDNGATVRVPESLLKLFDALPSPAVDDSVFP
ncbi:YbgC/FadM family acyl-CoA thioesterase [bacterium]|nr:YbgC/FadM family acyl-CoA thioesterase [bacterium]